jgi:nitroimidazol reductase NimA-like FMN-containing flavoprotein (pyridoxamine 5'-phosphate oxidase superfamily)
MARAMSVEGREAFLSGLHVGLVSLDAPPRAPQVTPMWYAYVPGGDVRILAPQVGPFSERLRRAQRATLCAQDEFPPYRYVTVEGPLVAVVPADRERDFRPLVERYLPHMWIEDYLRRMWPETEPSNGRMLMAQLKPETWESVDYWDDFAVYFGNAAR